MKKTEKELRKLKRSDLLELMLLQSEEIDRLRLSATFSLLERRDVIVVASVSCIYGLGDPIDYKNMVISLRTGMEKRREELIGHFKSVKAIRQASIEELCAVVPKNTAQAVWSYFRQEEEE